MIKKVLVIALFSIFSLNVHGQLIKMRTTEASYKVGDRDWTNWKKFEYLAIFNGDAKSLTIYSEPKDVYEIISKNVANKELGIIASFNCVDSEGEECIVEIRIVDGNQISQIHISYNNSIMVINAVIK